MEYCDQERDIQTKDLEYEYAHRQRHLAPVYQDLDTAHSSPRPKTRLIQATGGTAVRVGDDDVHHGRLAHLILEVYCLLLAIQGVMGQDKLRSVM